ncbi:hypothetical protein vseg_012671 [Gypsophila vaccaria]
MALSLQRYMQPEGYSPLIQLLKERSNQERERAISVAIENAEHLHESVIVEILSWLPVRSLLRFKSVCKLWYAIISSPDFISKHLKNYYDKSHDWRGFFIAQYGLTQSEYLSTVMFVDETPRVLADEHLVDTPDRTFLIYGPCDGLYYLYDAISSHYRRALWNPAINQLRLLPPLNPKPNHPENTTFWAGENYGFGYDVVSRDYKVVVIKGYLSTIDYYFSDYPQSVFVYSLRNDSWRYCGDLCRIYDLNCYNNTYYKFLNGCCYWLGYEYNLDDERRYAIVSFNMATDVFEEIILPDYMQLDSMWQCLAICADSLALLCVYPIDETVDIWVLKDGIWTIKFSMGPFPDVLRPIGHWDDNKVFLEFETGKLFLLDIESKEMMDLGFDSTRICCGLFKCMESLVSVKGESCKGKDEDRSVVKDDSSSNSEFVNQSESSESTLD